MEVGASVITKPIVIGKGRKKKLVIRERYLRNDLGCRSALCQQCPKKEPALLSSIIESPYIIPDLETITHFLELLVIFWSHNIHKKANFLIFFIFPTKRNFQQLKILF